MSRRVIDRSDWVSFADGFSRRHDGWLISVAVEEGSHSRRYVTRDAPLRGIVAEVHDDARSMMIFTSDGPHTTHFVEHAVSLEVEETDGAEATLTIADEDDVRTLLEFRSPMPPELVDGIAD